MSGMETAREEVARKVGQELANEAFAEVLREAAAKIRAKAQGCCDERCGELAAADLIDPDKKESADGAEAGRA